MPPCAIEWLEEARADIRRLDRTTAMRIFDGILSHAQTGAGNVEPLHGPLAGAFRLRVGGYRVLFSMEENRMRIFGVRSRRSLPLIEENPRCASPRSVAGAPARRHAAE
jgi:mRNA-degrading endonuclease RelE of RelBE toxin-antitoxin system